MRSIVVLILAVVVTSALFALYWTPYAIDDAWITYRYAEHLGSGQGFVYNPGERVLGTSTPLYTLLLASAHALGLSVPVVSYLVGFAAALGTLAGVFLLTRLLHSELAALLAVVALVMTPQFHKVATYGMETPLYVCMIVFAFYTSATNRRTLGIVLAAGCLVMRLDGAAVGAALFGAYLVEHRRLPWKHIALYLAIVLPWFAFSQLYFGTAVPK
jgi:4-amino-4-deoxy-L-arabinose transferase-like glycosyltransferase